MKATVRFVPSFNGPTLEITPLADNEVDRKRLEKLADLMPLRFRLPFANVSTLNLEAAEILHKHVHAWAKG